MFNLCFPFIPSLFYIVLNDDYMLCKVTLGVLKGASKLNVLLLLFRMHWFTFRSLEHRYFYLFIYFQFLRRCFKDANFSAIIQNQMEKPVGFLSREPRATLTSGLANTRHPSTTIL